MSGLELPTEPTPAVAELARVVMLLYGREGVGKTSLAAQFPKALFLCTEPGARHLELIRYDVSSWLDFKKACAAVPDHPSQTVVIDTIDIAYDYCQRTTCRKLGIDHPGDEGYGKGWDLCKRAFAEVISPLINCGKGVIFVSHETERTLEHRNGKKETRIVPSLSNTGRKILEPAADIVAYYGFGVDEDGDSTEDRFLQLTGDGMIFAKNRWGEMFSRSKINGGSSAVECYENFMKACSGGKALTPGTKKRRGLKVRTS